MVQLALQVLPEQAYGEQGTGAPTEQVPEPSQTLIGTSLPPEQLPGRHSVPEAYLAQPPRPLQAPLRPQLSRGCIAQTAWGSGLPAGAGVHSPMVPTWLQLTQGPVQERLQQTPSAQNSLAHSAAAPHTAPRGFLPQELSLQSRPSHCALVEQALKQRPSPVSQP